MPRYNIYPKKGEMFSIEIYRFELDGGQESFSLYDDADMVSNDGFLSFEDVAAIIPTDQRQARGLLCFRVHLKNRPPFDVFADAFEAVEPSVIFKYQTKDITRNVISEARIPQIYVALSEVVAIVPSDGLLSYRQ